MWGVDIVSTNEPYARVAMRISQYGVRAGVAVRAGFPTCLRFSSADACGLVSACVCMLRTSPVNGARKSNCARINQRVRDAARAVAWHYCQAATLR